MMRSTIDKLKSQNRPDECNLKFIGGFGVSAICVTTLCVTLLFSCGGDEGSTTLTQPWTKQLGVNGAQTDGMGIAIGPDKSIVVAGRTSGGLDGNTVTGSYDLYYTKYDSAGRRLYTRQSGTTGKTTLAFGVAVDSNNNVYAAGFTNGGLDGNIKIGDVDCLLTKYDNAGTRIYTKQTGSMGKTIKAYGVSVDGAGNVYIAGETTFGVDGNTLAGSNDAFLSKYDSSGNRLYTKQNGSAGGATYAVAVASQPSGTVYVTGDTSRGLDGNIQAGYTDVFVSKYAPTGEWVYTRQTGSLNANTYSSGVAGDLNDNVYVTGWTSGGLDGNTQIGVVDLFLLKYDSSGVWQYTKQMGSIGQNARATAIATDASNNVYITGVTTGGLDGNVLTGIQDLFIVKFNSSGAKVFTKQVGFKGLTMEVAAMAVDLNNYVYVTGTTDGGLDGNLLSGMHDMFIFKFDSNGKRL